MGAGMPATPKGWSRAPLSPCWCRAAPSAPSVRMSAISKPRTSIGCCPGSSPGSTSGTPYTSSPPSAPAGVRHASSPSTTSTSSTKSTGPSSSDTSAACNANATAPRPSASSRSSPGPRPKSTCAWAPPPATQCTTGLNHSSAGPSSPPQASTPTSPSSLASAW